MAKVNISLERPPRPPKNYTRDSTEAYMQTMYVYQHRLVGQIEQALKDMQKGEADNG